MTYDTRSPEEIEREIATERSQLRSTIDDLQERFSLDGVMRNVTDSVTENSTEIGLAVTRVVQRNPLAFGLAAGGLAWLAISNARASDDERLAGYEGGYGARGPIGDPYLDRKYGTNKLNEPRDPIPAGRPGPNAGMRTSYVGDDGEASIWARTRARVSNAAGSLRDRAGHAADDVRDRAGRASDSAKAGYAEARDGAEGYYARASRSARSRADSARVSARQLRDRLHEGTHDLSEEARKRVIAARTSAYEAQVKAEYYARRSRETASGFYNDQPLVVGAIAMAIGAAAGSVLPRSQREDAYFGAYSDELMDEAYRIWEEERAKLGDVASATAEEAKHQAHDLAKTMEADLKDAASDVEGKAREAVNETAKTAESEAKKKDIGGSAT
ncbi:DUF3618 domain-containing protein [Pseudoroseicyclus aestuarii]|uniref:Uncharacterized protein DUF3618 n=1 Tax=Pseudoroseicyclus aestuarii TaxID=1795041 RepID=A0A318SU00_9RHOB|nr:DUF3618 domain-containing protein [Pseudoroseicyclus aestuarii]PYE83716.1 uncharacterized protein DUF3618 [Pseudoroseicyclus aestuarii]